MIQWFVLLLTLSTSTAFAKQMIYWQQDASYGAVCISVGRADCNPADPEEAPYCPPEIADNRTCEARAGFKYNWVKDSNGDVGCKKQTPQGWTYQSVNTAYCKNIRNPFIEKLPEESTRPQPVKPQPRPEPVKPQPVKPPTPAPAPAPQPAPRPRPAPANDEFSQALREYAVVIYINKSVNTVANKEVGQRVYVYSQGKLVLKTKVSTGLEDWKSPPVAPGQNKDAKKYFATTPVGYFTPSFLEPLHYSNLWKVDMKNSIFFKDGIAMHAALPAKEPLLGQRDSGGCVRVLEKDSQIIFNLVAAAGQGPVPLIDRSGRLRRGKDGNVKQDLRYRTLVIVDDSAEAVPSQLQKIEAAVLQ
ncbi:MAG: L,D-transpeptidase [Pseudobdellovibrionaceae bacterium]